MVEGLVSGGFFHRLEVFARWDAVWRVDCSSGWEFWSKVERNWETLR